MKRLDIPQEGTQQPTQPLQGTVVTPPAQTFAPPPQQSFSPPATTGSSNVPAKIPVTMDEISKVGGDAQTQLAQVSQKITGVAKTSDMEGMGKLLTDTIMAAKGYDPNKLFKQGFLKGLFGKAESIRMRFDSVDGTVQRLVAQVDQRVSLFRGRVQDLEQLRIATENYHNSLQPQIDHLLQTADWMEQNVPQADPNDPMSANKVQEWLTVIEFARKRADDLRRGKVLAQQQVAQINQLKTNSTALAQKFSDIKATTIPALQNVFTAYVIALEQKKGAELADSIDAATEEALLKGAELMKQNTTQIHTSLGRAAISTKALQANYDSIMFQLDEVKRIQEETRQRIATETPQIEKLSQDLSQRLSQRS
jgi:uncharacterized protein YaaN involved in tellurite resistance